MNNRSYLFSCFIILFVLSACEDGFDCLKPSGSVTTEERVLGRFDKMNITGNVNVQIEYGAINSYTVTAGKNLIEGVSTKVLDGTLYINNNNGCNWVRSFKNEYVVALTIDTLVRLDYSGVGDVDFINDFEVDSLRIEVYDGWGNINLKYKGEYLRLIHNIGGVQFNASGFADDMYVYMADNGQTDLSNLETRLTNIWSISTGNCRVKVFEKLTARLSYIGNIYYSGNPVIIESTIESTGKLIAE